MKKSGKKDFHLGMLGGAEYSFEATLENFKRCRALSHSSPVDVRSKEFFERILQVKKVKDVFFGRAR